MISVAIIGSGAVGRDHARALSQIDGVRIAGFVDAVPTRAQGLAAEFGGEVWFSTQDVLGHVDAVTIATPPMYHADLASFFLARSTPVFCEKPLALSMPEVAKVAETAVRTNVPLVTGFKMRFEPIFQRARTLLAEIGEIHTIATTRHQAHTPKPGFDWVPQVGVMYELSIHDFDLIQYVTGRRCTRIQSAALDYRYGWPTENAFAILAEYGEGVLATLTGSYGRTGRWTGRDFMLTVSGEHGYLRIERPDRITLHLDRVHVEEVPRVNPLQPFVDELSNFIAVVRGQAEPFISIADAVAATAVVEASRLSFRQHRPVSLDELG